MIKPCRHNTLDSLSLRLITFLRKGGRTLEHQILHITQDLISGPRARVRMLKVHFLVLRERYGDVLQRYDGNMKPRHEAVPPQDVI